MMMRLIIEPVSIAVAQTFALARVSAPKICPAAYTRPAETSIRRATIGRRR